MSETSRDTRVTRVPPRQLYRWVATAEMITWTLLLIGMVLKYTGVTEWGVRIAGSVHGFVFLCYVASTVFVAANQRWRPAITLFGLGSAIVPWLTWPFDRWVDRRGLLDGDWHAEGAGLRGWMLRNPLAAIGLALVVVVAVMSALLWLGPPTGWATRFA